MLAKTHHAVIPWLCETAIPSTPGSIVPPPFVEDGPPPAPTEGGLPGSKVGHAPGAGAIQGRLEGVCLGPLRREIGLNSCVRCKGAPLVPSICGHLPMLGQGGGVGFGVLGYKNGLPHGWVRKSFFLMP